VSHGPIGPCDTGDSGRFNTISNTSRYDIGCRDVEDIEGAKKKKRKTKPREAPKQIHSEEIRLCIDCLQMFSTLIEFPVEMICEMLNSTLMSSGQQEEDQLIKTLEMAFNSSVG
jgi:hypothetical protein